MVQIVEVTEIVEIGDILLALGTLLLWLVALGLAALAFAIVSAILWPLNKFVSTITFGHVGSVPGTHAVIQFFTGLLGDAAGGVDAAAGSFWHGLKKLVVQVGEEIFGLAVLGAYLYVWAQTKLPLIIWHRFGAWVHKAAHAAMVVARRAERKAIHAEHYAETQVKAIDHRIGAIAHDIDHTILPELKSTRELAKEAEQLAKNAWDYITSKKFTNWVEGLVTAAIAATGLLAFEFLKCAEWRRLGGRLSCGMGQFLLDILEGAIAVMVIEDICAITDTAITVLESDEVQGFLAHVEDGMSDLFSCQGVDLAPPLTGPYYAPPPFQPVAALA